jgi:pyrroline-5-carboxylate reductase
MSQLSYQHVHDGSTAERRLLAPGRSLGVIGVGVMGQAILRGLLKSGAVTTDQAWGTSRSAQTCATMSAELGVPVERTVAHLLPTADILVLCVKPAQAATALATVKTSGALRPETLLISIVAGISLAQLSALLGSANPLVRAMPNTPCVVGEGMTALAGAEGTTPMHLARARQVFESVGRCVETEERHFDAITALSGSGPAYQYLIMEAMADAGVRVGLPRDLALTLVAQTALGAARMVQTSGRHPGCAPRRRDHPSRLHHRWLADARGRQDPVSAGPRDRRGNAYRRDTRQRTVEIVSPVHSGQ